MCSIITYSLRQVLPGLLVPLNAVDTIRFCLNYSLFPKLFHFLLFLIKKTSERFFSISLFEECIHLQLSQIILLDYEPKQIKMNCYDKLNLADHIPLSYNLPLLKNKIVFRQFFFKIGTLTIFLHSSTSTYKVPSGVLWGQDRPTSRKILWLCLVTPFLKSSHFSCILCFKSSANLCFFNTFFISQIYSRTNNAALLHSSLTHTLAHWVFVSFEKSFSWFVDWTTTEFHVQANLSL